MHNAVSHVVMTDLKEDTANPPHVHLVSVVAIGEKALRGSVPAGGNVLGVGLLGVDASTAAKVRQLQTLIYDQDVFRLDVPATITKPGHQADKHMAAGMHVW